MHMQSNRDYKKLFETAFENFADGTSFHGFHELHHAKTKIWRCIWVVILVAALSLTVYQVYISLFDYLDQTSVTMILPVDRGGLLYPPLSVCYIHWITWADWTKAISLGFTKESLLYAFSYITPIYSSEIFDIGQAKQQMINAMRENDMSSLSELYKAIAKPFPMVLALLGGGFLLEKPLFFHNITFRLTNGETYLCYTLEGDEILGMLKENQPQGGIKATGLNIFNFSIQDPTFEMYTSKVNYDEYNYYIGDWLLRKTNYWLVTVADYRKNYTGFTFPARVYPDANSDKYVEISKENDNYFIELRPTVYRRMNTPKDPCVQGAKAMYTDHHCEDVCQATLRKNLMICLALDFAMLLNDDTPEKLCTNQIMFLPIIFNETNQTVINYPANNQISTTTEITFSNYVKDKFVADFENCTNACENQCEIWKYEYSNSVTTLAAVARVLSFKNQTDIKIVYPEESDVLIMIDTDTRTWEDFVANIGGLLGVWTGASIVSFVELVYLCCCKDMACDCCMVKDKDMGFYRKKKGIIINPNFELSSIAISRSMQMIVTQQAIPASYASYA